MRTRMLLVVVVALSLVVAPAATGQSGKKTRNLNATVRMAVIGQDSSGNTFAGELVGKPIGRSGMVLRNAVSGSTSNGRAVVYGKRGTVRARVVNQIEPQPDGSVNLPGTFKITGGTGRYRGATGSGSFEARLPAGSTIYEADISGKIRY